ncbi:MAG: VOC family protein [Bacteroidia bacterium]|jgi:hypothetical protein
MEPRISVLTIGAQNQPALREFYENVLGWHPIASNKDIVFFKLNGLLLSICNKEMLADFIGVDPKGNGFRCVTIGYNVSTKEEVIDLYEMLKNKVIILKEPTEPPFGGLFFYFSDPEGNILEVAYNSFITLDTQMNAIGHLPINQL